MANCEARIIEQAENRVTVRTSRGDEFVIDADAAVKAFAELLSDEANERRGEWMLEKAWYKVAVNGMRKAVISENLRT